MSDKPRTDGQCHKCPAQTDVQAGNYSDKPFEEGPCFACRRVDYKQFPHRGKTVVSFDAAPPVETAADPRREQSEPDIDIDRFIDFLSEFMRLPATTRDIVGYRLLDLHGERHTYRMIAKRMRVTVQAAESRHRSAIRRIPALGALFKEKVAKQSRRGLN